MVDTYGSKAKPDLIELFNRDGGICHYCNEMCTVNIRNDPRERSRDHIFPRAYGGRDELSNYVLSCRECNNKKGDIIRYCSCDSCVDVIKSYEKEEFFSIIAFNRAKINVNRKGKFIVRFQGYNRVFPTLPLAMQDANRLIKQTDLKASKRRGSTFLLESE